MGNTGKKEYSKDFKLRAIELADEIGAFEASKKLGLPSAQTIGSWKRYLKPRETAEDKLQSMEEAQEEIKRLKKELAQEKRAVSILKDAAAFFCQDHLK
jgi:transposase